MYFCKDSLGWFNKVEGSNLDRGRDKVEVKSRDKIANYFSK